MFRSSSSSSRLHLRLPLLVFTALGLVLSLATLACAATTLNRFNSQQTTNPWLLPVWRDHFDLRGLKLVVGTSAAIVVFDVVAIVVMGLCVFHILSLPATTALTISATTSLLSACLALPAATLPLVLNTRAPGKDTLQSWTCSWVSRDISLQNGGMPGDFDTICGESRFATYSPLALLFLHLALLTLALAAVRKAQSSNSMRHAAASPGAEDGEKMVELDEYEKEKGQEKSPQVRSVTESI